MGNVIGSNEGEENMNGSSTVSNTLNEVSNAGNQIRISRVDEERLFRYSHLGETVKLDRFLIDYQNPMSGSLSKRRTTESSHNSKDDKGKGNDNSNSNINSNGNANNTSTSTSTSSSSSSNDVAGGEGMKMNEISLDEQMIKQQDEIMKREDYLRRRKRALLEKEDDTGRTALVVAIISPEANKKSLNKTDTVKVLLNHGADVHHVCRKARSWTALHFACSIGDIDVIKLLLQHGARPDAKDSVCLTPVDVVSSRTASLSFVKQSPSLSSKDEQTETQPPEAMLDQQQGNSIAQAPGADDQSRPKETIGDDGNDAKGKTENRKVQMPLKQGVSPLSIMSSRYGPKASIFGRSPASLVREVRNLIVKYSESRSPEAINNEFWIELIPHFEDESANAMRRKDSGIVREGERLAVNFRIPTDQLNVEATSYTSRYCIQLFIVGEKPWLMKPLLGRFQFIPANVSEGTVLIESETLQTGRGYRAVLIDEDENILASSRMIGIIADVFGASALLEAEDQSLNMNSVEPTDKNVLGELQEKSEEKEGEAGDQSSTGTDGNDRTKALNNLAGKRRLRSSRISSASSNETCVVEYNEDNPNILDCLDAKERASSASTSPGMQAVNPTNPVIANKRRVARKLSSKKVSFDSYSSQNSTVTSQVATKELLLKALSLSNHLNTNDNNGDNSVEKPGNEDERSDLRTPSPNNQSIRGSPTSFSPASEMDPKMPPILSLRNQKTSLRSWRSDSQDKGHQRTGSLLNPRNNKTLKSFNSEDVRGETQEQEQPYELGERKEGDFPHIRIDDSEKRSNMQRHRNQPYFRESLLSSISEHSMEESASASHSGTRTSSRSSLSQDFL